MGFVPQGARGIEHGKGFVAYEKDGVEHIKFTSHANLARQVAQATRYANHHGGDLPSSAFWNKAAEVYDDDVRLFRKEHQCRPLLALLRRDDAYDRDHPAVPSPVPTAPRPAPGDPLVPSPPLPLLQQPQVINPAAVPEPASVLSLGLGLLVVFVVGRGRAPGRQARTT